MTLRVDVLGPLRASVDGVEVRLGGRRERGVLAVLAAARGRLVGTDRLVDEVWGEDAPATVTGSLQVAVSRLRQVLEPGRPARTPHQVLVREQGGYLLRGLEVDADRFSEAAAATSGAAPAAALALTEEALALWRGEPYPDLQHVASLAAETVRLREDRLRLLEARASALLAAGRHDDAGSLLAPVIEEHPFRERAWSLLALALYRAGRQAESLETLRRLRTHLVEELGVDPSPSVRALEEDVLAQASTLDGPRQPEAGVAAGRADAAVVEARTRGGATRSRGTGVVGRAETLAALDAALHDVAQLGRGGVVLLVGEPGIGKTMLASELARRAGAAGVETLVGRCHEADVAPAYWPWLPVLRPLVGADAPPEVARLLGAHEEGPEVVSAGSAALRTFDAVTRTLDPGAEPRVVVLEDLHWSDVSSLRLLAFAAEALRDRPVLFVGTARDLEPGRGGPLAEAFAALARLGVRRLRVPPLRRDAVATLVSQTLGDGGDAGAEAGADDLVDVLLRRTDGNPFFVLELTRLLADAPEPGGLAARAASLEVPDGVRDVLRMRLARVGESARETLAAASVVGRTFEADDVARARGAPVLDDLDEALDAGLVQEAEGAGSYRFVHALARETVYGDLRPGRRSAWHAAVAEGLAARGGGDQVPEVAHHLQRAAAYRPDLLPAAVDATEAAARAAARRGAFDEALALWGEAVALAERAPDPDRTRLHVLLTEQARAQQRVGDVRGSVATLGRAIALARRADDWDRTAEAATSFRSMGIWHWREMGTLDTQTVDVLIGCLEHVGDPGLRARVWANLGLEYYTGLRSDEGQACAERSIELARAHGEVDVLRDCLAARAVALWVPGQARTREAHARELLTLPLAEEDRIAAYFQLGSSLHRQGAVAESDAWMDRAFALAGRLRHTFCDIPLAWWRWLRALESLSPQADELATAALALHRRSSAVGLAELSGLAVVLASGADGQVPPDVLAGARESPNGAYRVVIGHAAVCAGDVRPGRELIGDATPDQYDYASTMANALRLDALVRLDERDALPAAIDEIRRHEDEIASYGSVFTAGPGSLYVGRGLLALGESEEGIAHLRRALEVTLAAGLPRDERVVRDELDRAVAGQPRR